MRKLFFGLVHVKLWSTIFYDQSWTMKLFGKTLIHLKVGN